MRLTRLVLPAALPVAAPDRGATPPAWARWEFDVDDVTAGRPLNGADEGQR